MAVVNIQYFGRISRNTLTSNLKEDNPYLELEICLMTQDVFFFFSDHFPGDSCKGYYMKMLRFVRMAIRKVKCWSPRKT